MLISHFLRAYYFYMIVMNTYFRKKGAAPKKLEASPEEISKATQLAGKIMPVQKDGKYFPLT